MAVFKSINPFDQKTIAEYEIMSGKAVDAVLMRSEKAFSAWRKMHIDHRGEMFLKMAKLLHDKKEQLATLIAMEMGKVLTEGRAEIEKCAWNCEYYASHTAHMLEPEKLLSDADQSYVVFEPTGAVFAVMPWNFPFWQVFRFAAPSMMAGNVVILKHAPNVTGCSLAIESLFAEAGFPEHVFQSVIIDVDLVEKIIAADIVQGVTLTGSEMAGSAVASIAGKHIKKSVMELGGADPLIVLNDANIALAVKIAMQSRYQNAGQSCIASKRFIVESAIKDDFIQALLNQVNQLKQGDPLQEGTTTGPMARIDLAEKLEDQEKISVQKGAYVMAGGKRVGANFMPSLLTNVNEGMPAFDDEMFGPVASIIEAKNEMHAIELANHNRYGLGATLFSEDIEKAQRLARKIEAGAVFINAMVKSDPRLPFGGIKKSGFGRELSHYGVKEFTNIKTVYVKES